MEKENFDFLIFRIVVAVRDLEFEHRHGRADGHVLKSVLLHLTLYCRSPDGRRIYPGLQWLARKTSHNVRTIRDALAGLIELGYIIPESQRRGHKKGYALILEKLGLTLEDAQVKRKAPPAPPVPPDDAPLPDYTDGLPAQREKPPAPRESSLVLEQLRARRSAAQERRMKQAFGLE